MEVKNYIEKIVENNIVEDMHELSEIFEDVMEHLKNCDEKKYKKYELELYEMANGKILNKKMADEIVEHMQPFGMRWNIQQIENIQNDYGLNDISSIDLYVVMNSAYNDYNNIFQDDIEMYVKFAKDFILDQDAKQDKVYLYYTTIPLD